MLAVQLFRQERHRRRAPVDDDRRQLVGHVLDPLAVEAQEVGRVLHPPEDRPRDQRRPDWVEAKLELGDDPEVRAGAADAPEEVGVLALARADELAVGRDQVDRHELVDRQAVLPLQPADPAAEREPRETGVRHDPGRHREPERLRLAVELAEEDAGLGARRPRVRIDADPVHEPEVDDEAAVAERESGEAVAAASDGDG